MYNQRDQEYEIPNSQRDTGRDVRNNVMHSPLDITQRLSNIKLNDDTIVSRTMIPVRPKITNLDHLLADIHLRFISIRKEEFDLHYRVFSEVITMLHQNMKAVNEYYKRYANDICFAGINYDRFRIKKPDEFYMNIVIGLPETSKSPSNLQQSSIIIEEKFLEYVYLKGGNKYQYMIRDGMDCTIYEWLDDKNYFLHSKFMNWFRSIGDKALNMFPKQGSVACIVVDGVCYSVCTLTSGSAWTLIIKSPGFRLEVDLVPALQFPESRWPLGRSYRAMPPCCSLGYWFVVPTSNKGGDGLHDEERSWRLALHDQETQLMHNTYQLRETIRLIEKFKDEQGMNEIANYYIKTIFLWEIMEVDKSFWKRHSWTTLFRHMLQKFKTALDQGEIKYFWNPNYNLIGAINSNILREYSAKISMLLLAIDFDYKTVAKYILTDSEYKVYEDFV